MPVMPGGAPQPRREPRPEISRSVSDERADAADVVGMVASNVRALRTHAGLSLAQLAARSGVGKSTIAQLESGKANPSIETLFALAGVLDVPLADLFSAPDPAIRVVRKGDGLRLASSDPRFRGFLLASIRRHGVSELYIVDVTSGGARVAPPHAPGSVEYVLLASGRLRVGPLDQLTELEEGDLVSFDADVQHSYEALVPGTRAVLLLDYRSPSARVTAEWLDITER